eukprot:99073_1
MENNMNTFNQTQFYEFQMYQYQCQLQQMLIMKNNINKDKIIIFDWDDTCIPTTQIMKRNTPDTQQDTNPNKYINIEQLNNLGRNVYKVLNNYIEQFGQKNIFIVTNGSKGWVYLSLNYLKKIYKQKEHGEICNNYFELISRLLINKRISIISAHHLHSK